MKRRETLVERALEGWPYALALIPPAAEWLGHGRLPRGARALAVEIVSSLLVLALVAVIQRKSRLLEEMSVTDKLTGLYNSRYLRSELDRQVSLAHRARSSLSIIFMDIDNLKRVNDLLGHEAGSEVLRATAQAILTKVRVDMDLCFRLGGDEFVILCQHTGLKTAQKVADRVFAVPAELGARARGTTLSVAVAQLRPGETPGDFLRRGDRLMYGVKRSGKNRIALERPLPV